MTMSLPSLKIGDLTARLPIIQGGMGVGISLHRLAAAVAAEGGIGVIAGAMIGMREPDVAQDPTGANTRALQTEISKARALTDGIIGVNIMVALTDFASLVRTAISERADIIFSGAGLPLDLPGHLRAVCEEKKEEFRIVGISMPMHRELEKNFEVVPQMWGKAAVDGTLSRLAALMEGPPMGMLGVSNSCNPAVPLKYFIAVAISKEIDTTLEEFLVPAATWAVFCGSGTNTSIQELEKRILTEWLPSSGYEYGNAPDVEVYLNADPQNAKYEVWLPVIKKQA